MEELFAGTTINVGQMLDHLSRVAASLGLPFGDRRKTYNSRLAQEVGLWAESLGMGHAFHAAAFHAYFADGKNLADHDVLVGIAEAAGLDPALAAEVLQERSFSEAVDSHWRLSRDKGITAVPTFLAAEARLTGAQRYNDLVRFIEEAAGPLKKKAST